MKNIGKNYLLLKGNLQFLRTTEIARFQRLFWRNIPENVSQTILEEIFAKTLQNDFANFGHKKDFHKPLKNKSSGKIIQLNRFPSLRSRLKYFLT